MKKLLSILLAVILAFSAFTMVSFAEDAETTVPVEEAPTDTPDESTDVIESLTAKWFDEYFNNGNIVNANVAIKVVYANTGDDMPDAIYAKDGKIVFNFPLKLGLLTLKPTVIFDINRKTCSIYFSSFPFFYITLPTTNDQNNNLLNTIMSFDTSDLVPEESKYVQVDGTEYYVEEYYDGDLHAYFKDGDLVRMERDDTLIEISYDVSDEDVSLPSLALNVTPLVIFFGLFGLI